MIAHSSTIDVRINAPSATIILNRPATRNALCAESVQKLQQAFSDLHLEKKVAAVIVTGAENAFCSGTDLKEMKSNLLEDDAQDKWHDESLAMNELLETILRFPKPVIAAVNGPALGFGFAIALACDLLVAGPQAKFGCPEIKRGLVPGMVTALLAFRLGAAHAAKYALTARNIGVEEALTAGFCHESVQEDRVLWAKANEIAQELSHNSPVSMKMTKQLLNETIGESFLTNLSLGTANTAAARTTETAKEGVDAFVEKRPPEWP